MKTAKRVCLNLIVVLTLIIASLFTIPSKTAFAENANEKVDLATSDVLLDLNDGKKTTEADFNGRDYEQYKDIHIIRVYADWTKKYNSAYKLWTSSVTFYLYVYNPKLHNIVEDGRNKIQYRIYNPDEDLYLGAKWDKAAISLVNKTSDGKYLKYSVTLSDGKSSYKEFSFSPFNFAISGIELLKSGDANASEWGVGGIYNVIKSNDKVAVSTKQLNTLTVDVSHTAYRTGYSDEDNYTEDQVSSCYFSLPTAYGYGGEYGNLAEVTAEYERYKTKPIVILNNAFKDTNVISQCLGAKDCGTDYRLKYRCGTSRSTTAQGINYRSQYGLGYLQKAKGHYTVNLVKDIPWLFVDENYSGNFKDDIDTYSFGGEKLNAFFNSNSTLYSAYYGKSREERKTLLFENPEENMDGYQKHLYSIAQNPSSGDAITNFDFNVLDEKASDNFWRALFNVKAGEASSCKPLARFDFKDLSLSDDTLSKTYLIGKQDIFKFRAFAIEKQLKKEDVWLFRYDKCVYTSAYGTAEYYPGSDDSEKLEGACLYAQEYVYLDFDILSFGFEQSDGSIWTIPVVHSPDDVFNDITVTNPENPFRDKHSELMALILAVLALIVVVFLIIYFWPYVGPIIKVVLKLLLWLITLPFKLINSLINKIKANNRKKKSSAKPKREKKRK